MLDKEVGDIGRKPRVEFYGAIYHLIQRGNNRSYIFKDEEHKAMLLQIVEDAKRENDFRLLGYVIMDNHYHFLIQTMNDRISRVMHRINTRCSKYYNIKEKRSRPNFDRRYFAKLVENEKYLFTLLYYIHHNPVKANIVSKVNEYYYSSDSAYRDNDDSKVNIHYLLNIYSTDRKTAIKKYCEMMDGIEPMDQVEIEVKKMFETYIAIRSKGKSLDELLMDICPFTVEFNLIKNRSKKQNLTDYKLRYIKHGLLEHYTYEEIGKNINITGSAVEKLLLRKEERWLQQSLVFQQREFKDN